MGGGNLLFPSREGSLRLLLDSSLLAYHFLSPDRRLGRYPAAGSGDDNKEKDHETHGTRRKTPHRVHARLRGQGGGHRKGAGEVGIDHFPRAALAPHRQRQEARLLEQALRPLRRMPEDRLQRVPERPAEELAGMLRVVPRLRRGRLPAPEPRAARVQRLQKERNCPPRKRYYIASAAHANYSGTLVNSRMGMHLDNKTIMVTSDI